MKPPAVGPMIDARPNTPPKTPCMRALVCGVKMSARTVNTEAKRTPPKRPCAPRKRISSVMFWLSPHNQLMAMNPAMPAMMKGLRPNRSPSLPAIGTVMVEVSRYAVVTQA